MSQGFFNRHDPRSLLRQSTCASVCRTLLWVAFVAATSSATVYFKDLRPALARLDSVSRDDIVGKLAVDARDLPEARLVVSPNGTLAINKPLPALLSGTFGDTTLRVAFEADDVDPDMLYRKYGAGNSAAHVDAVVSGATVMVLDVSQLDEASKATYDEATGVVALKFKTFLLNETRAAEVALAALCEAYQPEELEGAVVREDAARRAFAREAIAAGATVRDAGPAGSRAVERQVGLSPAQHEKLRVALAAAARWRDAGQMAAHAHRGYPDVVTARLSRWWGRVRAAIEARQAAAEGAGDEDHGDGVGGADLFARRLPQPRRRRSDPVRDTLDEAAADAAAAAVAGGDGHADGRAQARAGRAGARNRRTAPADEAVGPVESVLRFLGEAVAGSEDSEGFGERSAFTSAYVCTRETLQAAVEDLPRNPAWARLTEGNSFLALALGLVWSAAFVDALVFTYRHVAGVAIPVFLAQLACWRAGATQSRTRPVFREITRLLLAVFAPLTLFFRVAVPYWLPEATGSIAGASPLSSPRALLASLRLTSPLAQWAVHFFVAGVAAAYLYDAPDPPEAAAAAVTGAAPPMAAAGGALAANAAGGTAARSQAAPTGPQSQQLLDLLTRARGDASAERLAAAAASLSQLRRPHRRSGSSDAGLGHRSVGKTGSHGSAARDGVRRRVPAQDTTSSGDARAARIAELQRQVEQAQASVVAQIAALQAAQQHHMMGLAQALTAMQMHQQPYAFGAAGTPQLQYPFQ